MYPKHLYKARFQAVKNEFPYPEKDILAMDLDLVIGGRPDRILELLSHLDFTGDPPGPELSRLIEEREKKLGIEGDA